MAITMKAPDTVSSPLAECFIIIENRRYNFMQAIDLEASIEKIKTEVPILGRLGKGNKSVGWKGTGKAKFHYNSSVLRKLLYKYKTDFIDTYFDIQITNEDKMSAVGRQTIILKDCNLNGITLAKFDASSDDCLTEEIEFTFEDWEMPEEFTELQGM